MAKDNNLGKSILDETASRVLRSLAAQMEEVRNVPGIKAIGECTPGNFGLPDCVIEYAVSSVLMFTEGKSDFRKSDETPSGFNIDNWLLGEWKTFLLVTDRCPDQFSLDWFSKIMCAALISSDAKAPKFLINYRINRRKYEYCTYLSHAELKKFLRLLSSTEGKDECERLLTHQRFFQSAIQRASYTHASSNDLIEIIDEFGKLEETYIAFRHSIRTLVAKNKFFLVNYVANNIPDILRTLTSKDLESVYDMRMYFALKRSGMPREKLLSVLLSLKEYTLEDIESECLELGCENYIDRCFIRHFYFKDEPFGLLDRFRSYDECVVVFEQVQQIAFKNRDAANAHKFLTKFSQLISLDQ